MLHFCVQAKNRTRAEYKNKDRCARMNGNRTCGESTDVHSHTHKQQPQSLSISDQNRNTDGATAAPIRPMRPLHASSKDRKQGKVVWLGIETQTLASMMFMVAALTPLEAVNIEVRERRFGTLCSRAQCESRGYSRPILLDGTFRRHFRRANLT